MVRRRMCAIGAGLVLMAVASAQDAGRRATFALVTAADGKPLAGAVVTFAGSLLGGGPGPGGVDLQQVRSDARGRARANLDPRLCYVAWASSPLADGAASLSPQLGFFAAGAMIELRCRHRQVARTVAVDGVAAWLEHGGPLRFFAMGKGRAPEAELHPDADGVLSTPPVPDLVIELRLADGQPLAFADADVGTLHVPPPQAVRVLVTDSAGRPMAGVTISHRVWRVPSWEPDRVSGISADRLRALGVSDARGEAQVVVPYGSDPMEGSLQEDLLLLVQADGRPEVMGGIKGRKRYESDHQVERFEGGVVHFVVPDTASLNGRCAGAPAGSVAHLSGVCKLYLDRTSYAHDTRAFVAPLDGEGRFVFATLPAELHSCRIEIVPPEGSGAGPWLFRARSGRTLPEVLVDRGATETLPVVDVQVEVKEPLGGPARGAVGYLVPTDLRGTLMRDSVVRFPLSPSGAAALKIEPGSWIAVVQSEHGWAAQRFEAERAGSKVALVMEPLARMRVQLLDQAGEPIAGANLQPRSSSTRGSADPTLTVLQGLRQLSRGDWARIETDAEGRAVVPFVPLASVTQRLGFQWSKGVSEDFELVAGEEWVTVRPK